MWEINKDRLAAVLCLYTSACDAKRPRLAGVVYAMLIQANDYLLSIGEQIMSDEIVRIIGYYNNYGAIELLSGKVDI